MPKAKTIGMLNVMRSPVHANEITTRTGPLKDLIPKIRQRAARKAIDTRHEKASRLHPIRKTRPIK